MLDLLARLLTRVVPFRHNDLADLNLYLERRNIMNVDVIYLNFQIRKILAGYSALKNHKN